MPIRRHTKPWRACHAALIAGMSACASTVPDPVARPTSLLERAVVERADDKVAGEVRVSDTGQLVIVPYDVEIDDPARVVVPPGTPVFDALGVLPSGALQPGADAVIYVARDPAGGPLRAIGVRILDDAESRGQERREARELRPRG